MWNLGILRTDWTELELNGLLADAEYRIQRIEGALLLLDPSVRSPYPIQQFVLLPSRLEAGEHEYEICMDSSLSALFPFRKARVAWIGQCGLPLSEYEIHLDSNRLLLRERITPNHPMLMITHLMSNAIGDITHIASGRKQYLMLSPYATEWLRREQVVTTDEFVFVSVPYTEDFANCARLLHGGYRHDDQLWVFTRDKLPWIMNHLRRIYPIDRDDANGRV